MNRRDDGITIRPAKRTDVPDIAAMFASDTLGGHGDSAAPEDLPHYLAAFDRISENANDRLYVAEAGGVLAGTFQTTLVTMLTGRGSTSLIIEAVHVRHDMRGRGIGEAMVRHAIAQGKSAGVRLVQLTSSLKRTDAHRFYERLGFVQSHAGFKMKLG